MLIKTFLQVLETLRPVIHLINIVKSPINLGGFHLGDFGDSHEISFTELQIHTQQHSPSD